MTASVYFSFTISFSISPDDKAGDDETGGRAITQTRLKQEVCSGRSVELL